MTTRKLIFKHYLVSDKVNDKIQNEEECVVYLIWIWVSWSLWHFTNACNPPKSGHC